VDACYARLIRHMSKDAPRTGDDDAVDLRLSHDDLRFASK